VKVLLRQAVLSFWPAASTKGQVLGLGYAVPLLRPYLGTAERVIAAMPAQQGVTHWPLDEANRAVLVPEDILPFPDCSFDRIVMLHALEGSENSRALLRETWRVLAPGGRVLVLVPNRLGWWARHEHTPFAWGHPYSMAQLKRQLVSSRFTPMRQERLLHAPAFAMRLSLHRINALNTMLQYCCSATSGLIAMEATKQLYAPVSESASQSVLSFRPFARPAVAACEENRNNLQTDPQK
jgi:SAM-dependent methyltransferase